MNMHTFIVTGSKPWTTIHPDMIGTELEMLDLCPAKLIHLGEYIFGRLIPKPHPTGVNLAPAAATSTNSAQAPLDHTKPGGPTETTRTAPVQDSSYQDSAPPLALPTPYEELQTAHTFVTWSLLSPARLRKVRV